jgi:FAD/FMN-containing dehydrogenase
LKSIISSWGRLFKVRSTCIDLQDQYQAIELIQTSKKVIPYGMGRSYGDVCLLSDGETYKTPKMDRYIDFNDQTGILECESGVLLGEIQAFAIKKGFLLAVTPGTQYVTLGGAIANDVHGKNHHRYGSFGNTVVSLKLLRSDGMILECSPEMNQGYYSATIGGIGLTGIILSAKIQLRLVKSSMLLVEKDYFYSLVEFIELSKKSESTWEYSVAWIDCLQKKKIRGVFFKANHSDDDSHAFKSNQAITFPFVPPISLVGTLTLKWFNRAYFLGNLLKSKPSLVHYTNFFYPLDRIRNWNRIYGAKGFFQYQCVIPGDKTNVGMEELLDVISSSGMGSFLAVLKQFGNIPSVGMMSFPMPGITLALDFPNRGEKTKQLFNRLDCIVKSYGGRIYMAKDARMPKDVFIAGYPNYKDFTNFRDSKFSSMMSQRLM